VIEIYPLPFLEEVKKKFRSAAFFTKFSSLPVRWKPHYVLKKFCSEKHIKARKFEDISSLLLFGPSSHAIALDLKSNPIFEHPAL
jgi:hypothetical protein